MGHSLLYKNSCDLLSESLWNNTTFPELIHGSNTSYKIITEHNVEMACGPLFHFLCMQLAIAGLLGFLILFCNPAIFQWWLANDLDTCDTHILTAIYSKLVHHCTFKSTWWNLASQVFILGKVVYGREHIFLETMELANHKSFPAN